MYKHREHPQRVDEADSDSVQNSSPDVGWQRWFLSLLFYHPLYRSKRLIKLDTKTSLCMYGWSHGSIPSSPFCRSNLDTHICDFDQAWLIQVPTFSVFVYKRGSRVCRPNALTRHIVGQFVSDHHRIRSPCGSLSAASCRGDKKRDSIRGKTWNDSRQWHYWVIQINIIIFFACQ